MKQNGCAEPSAIGSVVHGHPRIRIPLRDGDGNHDEHCDRPAGDDHEDDAKEFHESIDEICSIFSCNFASSSTGRESLISISSSRLTQLRQPAYASVIVIGTTTGSAHVRTAITCTA